MTASVPMSVFHQWLLADPASQNSACSIILHGDESLADDAMIHDITDYLNEYDDDGDGRWLPTTEELVDKISRDPSHRRLLGMAEPATQDPDPAQSEFKNTLSAIGQRGHVVFRSPGISEQELKLTNTFHAGVGQAQAIKEKCHLILDPDLMDHKCIAHIIGDVFLEWLNSETRRNPPIQDIR